MLGAQELDDFEANQQAMTVEPGTCLVAYTDGILEAKDPGGTMLGLDRLRALLRHADEEAEWPTRLDTFASNFARGNFNDDVLVVSLNYRERSDGGKVTRS